MFRRFLLLAASFSVAYSWCTPFIACNQTIYGDFNDLEKGLKVVLLGRPFQKNDEIIITGEYWNNGSEVFDDAQFTTGLSKGLIMHQLGNNPENYLLTLTMESNATMMNVTGVAKSSFTSYGLQALPKPINVTCESPFTYRITSVDGYGFAFGTETKYVSKIPFQYPKVNRAQSIFFDGQIKTTKMELRCRD